MAPATSSAGAPTFDWVYAEVVMPVDARSFTLSLGAEGKLPAVALYKGSGFVLGDDGTPRVSVERYRSEPVDVITRVGPVHQHFQIQQSGMEGWGLGMGWDIRASVDAGEMVSMLLFVPGAKFDAALSSGIVVDGAFYPAKITTGQGAQLLRITEGAGASIAAAGEAAGVSTIRRAPAVGIVGALNFQCSLRCETSWHSPDARGGGWSQQRVANSAGVGSGRPDFAGPAGPWSWDFAGVQDGEVIGAYAPVGDAWSHFAAG